MPTHKWYNARRIRLALVDTCDGDWRTGAGVYWGGVAPFLLVWATRVSRIDAQIPEILGKALRLFLLA